MQIDKFADSLLSKRAQGQVPTALPNVADEVVIYGYGSEVDSLIEELKSRAIPVVILEEDLNTARELYLSGENVVHVSLGDDDFDLTPLTGARAMVANGSDELNAVFALWAREHGFEGPLVATIENPGRRVPKSVLW